MSEIIKITFILPLIDAIYLKLISAKFNKQILDIQSSEMKFRLLPAILCYVALIFGLYYFIIKTDTTREKKIMNAFLLGLVIYAVYETTNYATIDKWQPEIVVIDSLWGGVLFALTTFLVTLKF